MRARSRRPLTCFSRYASNQSSSGTQWCTSPCGRTRARAGRRAGRRAVGFCNGGRRPRRVAPMKACACRPLPASTQQTQQVPWNQTPRRSRPALQPAPPAGAPARHRWPRAPPPAVGAGLSGWGGTSARASEGGGGAVLAPQCMAMTCSTAPCRPMPVQRGLRRGCAPPAGGGDRQCDRRRQPTLRPPALDVTESQSGCSWRGSACQQGAGPRSLACRHARSRAGRPWRLPAALCTPAPRSRSWGRAMGAPPTPHAPAR